MDRKTVEIGEKDKVRNQKIAGTLLEMQGASEGAAENGDRRGACEKAVLGDVTVAKEDKKW